MAFFRNSKQPLGILLYHTRLSNCSGHRYSTWATEGASLAQSTDTKVSKNAYMYWVSRKFNCQAASSAEQMSLIKQLRERTSLSGKSQMVIEKMVEGRLHKYFEEVVLMEQKYFLNDSPSFKVILNNLSKEVGSPVKISNFFRMEVGEGIQRLETSSMDELVAQAL